MTAASVILPTYNRENHIRRSLKSVIDQEGVDFEVIVVDDCSTDNTYEQIADLVDGRRVKFITTPRSVGAAQARNLGAQMAQGKYLAFQDSDDAWLPGKLQMQVDALELGTDDEVLNYCSHFKVAGVDQIVIPGEQSRVLSGDIFAELLKDSFISTQTMVIQKDKFAEIGGFDASLLRYQDWDLALRLADQYRVQHLNCPLVIVYETPDSLTSSTENHLAAKLAVISKWKNDPRFPKSLQAFHLYFLALEAFERRLYEKAATLALRSATMKPRKLRSWLLYLKSTAVALGKKKLPGTKAAMLAIAVPFFAAIDPPGWTIG
jgi:glycosyltransferase involved in cell wall biosynthesis